MQRWMAEWDASEGGIFVKGARVRGKCSWGNMSEVSESCRGQGRIRGILAREQSVEGSRAH
ncbi:hypothetical protein A6B38_00030 [Bartonella bacilliformis]|uniref:Uncharacterized protein n=1 Tax=Bartonella bacilliformis INS TaxID=1206782 RepID=A0ABN0IHW4_BARBA|nr:hypothetical protein AL467_01120 [Bartonella bacilliformis]EKS46094.1 hypothetical protein BbINS_00990 [Bartonella bacilliformis INS]KZM38087.1 hypothetical protein AWH67_00200 [Bartonella bacilliformis]KZN22100.1 hypothetical protein A6B38_00030 [Bartonella bacilliformis]